MSDLDEYRAVVAKIDAAVSQLAARADDALQCARGCAQCCAPGLTVTGVEAAFIEAFLEDNQVVPSSGDACAFLDDEGACQIYPARPLVCRTQGLALKIDDNVQNVRRLPILNNSVTACELNYQGRLPSGDEIFDTALSTQLLFVVDQRFSGASERTSLDALARRAART